MSEIITVCAIVGLVAFLVGRSLLRTLAGKTAGCGCGSGCPLSGTCRQSSDSVIPEQSGGK